DHDRPQADALDGREPGRHRHHGRRAVGVRVVARLRRGVRRPGHRRARRRRPVRRRPGRRLRGRRGLPLVLPRRQLAGARPRQPRRRRHLQRLRAQRHRPARRTAGGRRLVGQVDHQDRRLRRHQPRRLRL
ncbi:MAG: hypothetical protein AVDCRST_MAG06-2883, partial [uncultured Nocardioides sp.]